MLDAYYEPKLFFEADIPYAFRIYNLSIEGSRPVAYPHYHEFIEFIYCLDGTIELVLDDSTTLLTSGDLAIIHSKVNHATYSLTEGLNRYIAILFEPQLLYNTNHSAFEMKYMLPFQQHSSKNKSIFTANDLKGTPIVDLLDAILLEDTHKNYGFELAIRTHLSSIGLWLLRYWHANGLHLSTTQDLAPHTISRITLIIDYIDQHYMDDLSIHDMATLCNVTYSYFSRFFKRYMHQNFKEYLNLVRITKAEHLLVQTNQNVTDIGTSVGFTTTSYFIEQFKLHRHMTPKKYRNLRTQQFSMNPTPHTHTFN